MLNKFSLCKLMFSTISIASLAIGITQIHNAEMIGFSLFLATMGILSVYVLHIEEKNELEYNEKNLQE